MEDLEDALEGVSGGVEVAEALPEPDVRPELGEVVDAVVDVVDLRSQVLPGAGE